MAELKTSTDSALHACGRDRIMHRYAGGKPAIAIRWDQERRATAPDGTQGFLVREADTLDEAGKLAARAFAERLRELAKSYEEWARNIERHLREGGRG